MIGLIILAVIILAVSLAAWEHDKTRWSERDATERAERAEARAAQLSALVYRPHGYQGDGNGYCVVCAEPRTTHP